MLKRGLEDTSIGEILEQVEDNQGTLYLVMNGEKLKAVTYFQQFGDILNLKLSGEDLKDWALEFQAFVIELMQTHSIPKLVVMSRKGWHRVFPMLNFEGAIYTFSLADT